MWHWRLSMRALVFRARFLWCAIGEVGTDLLA